MNEIDLELTLERAELIVARCQEAFETAVEGLRDSVRVLRSMPETGERDVLKDVRQMNGAYLFAIEMQEKARVAGSRHFGTGAGNGGSGRLDLEAARAEIAERLARLRAAGVADRVP
jgi:hypothetical protein